MLGITFISNFFQYMVTDVVLLENGKHLFLEKLVWISVFSMFFCKRECCNFMQVM